MPPEASSLSSTTTFAPVAPVSSPTPPPAVTPVTAGKQTWVPVVAPEGRILYMEEERYNLTKSLLKAGEDVALIGPPGSGKTDFGRAVLHQALNANVLKHVFQMEYGGITSGDLLDGERTLDADGKLAVIASQWLVAVRHAAAGTPVGIVHDEHNRATPTGVNKQLRAFSHKEYVCDADGKVYKWEPKNLMNISTLNVGFGFTGTSKVDDAFADRFHAIQLELPPAEIVERILTDRYPTLDNATRRGVIRAYTASQTDDESYQLGVRDVLKITNGVVYGGLKLRESVHILIGGAVALRNMPEESVEAIITAVSATTA